MQHIDLIPDDVRYWFVAQPLDVLEREFSILEGIMLAKREAAKFVSAPKERKKRVDAGRKRTSADYSQMSDNLLRNPQ